MLKQYFTQRKPSLSQGFIASPNRNLQRKTSAPHLKVITPVKNRQVAANQLAVRAASMEASGHLPSNGRKDIRRASYQTKIAIGVKAGSRKHGIGNSGGGSQVLFDLKQQIPEQ